MNKPELLDYMESKTACSPAMDWVKDTEGTPQELWVALCSPDGGGYGYGYDYGSGYGYGYGDGYGRGDGYGSRFKIEFSGQYVTIGCETMPAAEWLSGAGLELAKAEGLSGLEIEIYRAIITKASKS